MSVNGDDKVPPGLRAALTRLVTAHVWRVVRRERKRRLFVADEAATLLEHTDSRGGAKSRRRSGAPARHHTWAMLDCLLLLVAFVRAAVGGRAGLAVENLLLRRQLAVLTRPTRKRPRLRRCDRVFWVLARLLWRRWGEHLAVVRPQTVSRWPRQGWRLVWRWRSRPRPGRPRLSAEVQELIATMARDNPRWGSGRIRGELLKLGIAVSKRSIQRYRRRGPAHPPSQTWRTFLRNHAHQLWAADLLVVPTLTFKVLYVLVLIAHGRHELIRVAVTAQPTAAWLWRQPVEATPWGWRPRFLLRDRDAVYGGACGAKLRALGTEQLLTPVRAPRANAVAERVIGTVRRECLDHVVVVNQRHLRTLLGEFADSCSRERPHRTLRLETPLPASRSPTGQIRVRPVLGGLPRIYKRAA